MCLKIPFQNDKTRTQFSKSRSTIFFKITISKQLTDFSLIMCQRLSVHHRCNSWAKSFSCGLLLDLPCLLITCLFFMYLSPFISHSGSPVHKKIPETLFMTRGKQKHILLNTFFLCICGKKRHWSDTSKLC